jgi:hypothetical protein
MLDYLVSKSFELQGVQLTSAQNRTAITALVQSNQRLIELQPSNEWVRANNSAELLSEADIEKQ